ncbi:MAG: carboxypeptidase regulatory-like domain-containing protein [Nitrososphaerota archaeon]
MYKSLTAIITSALLLAAAITLTTPQASAAPDPIKFVIKTKEGSSPVPSAIVKLNGTAAQGTTDNNGEATLSANPKANNTVTVEFRGIQVFQQNNLNVSAVDPTSPYVVTLMVNVSTLVLNIESDSGASVPGSSVRVEYGAGLSNATSSGSDGRASIPLIPFTSITVKVSYRGYDVGDSTADFRGAPIRVRVALYRMTVNVLDASNSGVPSATIRVWYGPKQSGNNTGFASGTTDSGGVSRLDLLPNGQYHLEVEFRGEVVFTSPARVEINGASVTYNARTDLTRYSVTVYDADGNDVISGSQYRLSAELLRGSSRYSEATTTTGVLDLGLVKPREYTLIVKLGDYEVFRGPINAPAETRVNGRFYDILVRVEAPRTPSEQLVRSVGLRMVLGTVFTLEGVTRDSGISFNNLPAGRYRYEVSHGPYTIGSGEVDVDSEGKRIVITPTLNTLTLNILNADSEPIRGRVYLSSYDDIRMGVYDADTDGVVEVDGLIPISYRLYVEYRGVRVLEPTEIVLDSSKEENVITKVYNIVLEVLDADGRDHLANASIIVEGGSIAETAESGEDGMAMVKNLPVGQYTVSVEYLGIPVHREEVRVDASKTFKLNSKSVIDVDVEVVDSESNFLESGSVTIVLGRARFSGEVVDGKVRFENVPSGSYRAVVNYLGFVVYDRPVTLSIDEDRVRLLSNVYYLTVVVVKADNTPLAGAQVKASTSSKLVGQAVTDSGGRAELKLPKGDFSVDVLFQGTAVASQIASVAQSGALNVQAKVYRIDLKVVTPDGSPVAGAEVTLSRDNSAIVSSDTDEGGEALIYVAEGDYGWVTKIGEYTYSSNFKARENKSLTLLHVIDNLQNQGIVLGATAAVSASSVFGLLRWGRPRVRPQRQRPAPSRRPLPSGREGGPNLKRPRMPRI